MYERMYVHMYKNGLVECLICARETSHALCLSICMYACT